MRPNLTDITVKCRIGKPAAQNSLRCLVDLALPEGLEARPLKAKVKPANASE
jgi:hypothetical protein